MKRGGRVNPVSTKRARLNRERAEVVAEIRETRRSCEAHPLLVAAAHAAAGVDQEKYVMALRECQPFNPQEPHEPRKRSRGGSIVDPAGIQLLCPPCHRFSEAEVRLSQRAGLLVSSRPVDRILWKRP